MSLARLARPLLLTIALVEACSESGSGGKPITCVPGESRSCTGPAACSGYEVCRGDGKAFEACSCQDASVGGTGGGGGAGGTDSPTGGTGGTSGATGGAAGSGGSAGAAGDGATTDADADADDAQPDADANPDVMDASGEADAPEAAVDTGVDTGSDGGPACPATAGPTMVKVGDYCVDSTEVTATQYAAFLSAKGSDTSGQPTHCSWNSTYDPDGTPACVAAKSNPNNPAVCIDWCDALAYCKWAGKRLCGKIGGGSLGFAEGTNPVLSQWFNACSAGGSKTYPYGAGYQLYTCNGSGYQAIKVLPSLKTCEGGYPGIYDMSGNAWEWEDSCNGTSGASDKCALRGGAFTSDANYLTCSFIANGNARGFSNDSIGFRCCS